MHKRTVDHLPSRTGYERFIALAITQNVGTMACFWLFCVISLSSLLAVLYAALYRFKTHRTVFDLGIHEISYAAW